MDFALSPRVEDYLARLKAFMEAHVYPAERALWAEVDQEHRWHHLKGLDALKEKAKAEGLWNLWCPEDLQEAALGAGQGLSNLEYATLCEEMGRVHPFGPEVFNCSAPDTGNMETFARYGTDAQKDRWLKPLLAGDIRSAFLMTEPEVASSDATNVETRIIRDGDDYVINGRKWWASGALDPRCEIFIVMGKSDPDNPERHRQQSMILVPANTPGVTLKRALPVFGFDDAPHGHAEVLLEDVRVPAENILLGEGRGFEIAQGRLGPGRIHHCMRTIGLCERVLELMCDRLEKRVAFGKPLSEQSVWRERIAEARILLDMNRLLTLKAAYMMDTVGNKVARKEIGMIKVAAPDMGCKIIDWAIQAFGGAGIANDYYLPLFYGWTRALRVIDGPDEVHRDQIARLELREMAQKNREARGADASVPPRDFEADDWQKRQARGY